MKDKNKDKNLRSGATSLFDVQLWTFDVGRSFFNILDVHPLKWVHYD